MKPTKIDGANLRLGAPRDWQGGDEVPVADLEIKAEKLFDGVQMLSSAWSPDREELDRLAAGAPVVLTVVGNSHPVVALGVGEVQAAPYSANDILDALDDLLNFGNLEPVDRRRIDARRQAMRILEAFGHSVDNRADNLKIVR